MSTPPPPGTPEDSPVDPQVPPAPQAPEGAEPAYPAAPAPEAAYPAAGATYPAAPAPDATYPPATPYGTPAEAAYPGAPTAYGAPAYGAPAYGAPAYGAAPTMAPPADGRPKTLAIIALVLAGVGAILAFIPFVTWFSGLLLLPGFIVGLIALISKKHGGKGFSIAALIVSVIGWIVSLVMTFVSIGLMGQAAWDQATVDEIGGTGGSSDSAPADNADDEPAGAREDLEVVEASFGRSEAGGDTWWYVIILDNPNADYIFDFAEISVEALDAEGTILDTSSTYRTLLSGATAVTGSFLDVGAAEISELSVLLPEAIDATSSPASETGTFTVEGITPTTDEYYTTVRGTVSGTFDTDQEYVEVVVVARNGAGAIIGAQSGYVDRLPADGSKVQFEVMFWEPLPADTTYEAFPGLM